MLCKQTIPTDLTGSQLIPADASAFPTAPSSMSPLTDRIMFRTTDVARLLGLVETPAPTDLDVVVERLDEAVHLLRIIAAALSRPTLGRVS